MRPSPVRSRIRCVRNRQWRPEALREAGQRCPALCPQAADGHLFPDGTGPDELMFNARDLLYFAGSVPLPNCEDVFRSLSGEVGQFLRQSPLKLLRFLPRYGVAPRVSPTLGRSGFSRRLVGAGSSIRGPRPRNDAPYTCLRAARGHVVSAAASLPSRWVSLSRWASPPPSLPSNIDRRTRIGGHDNWCRGAF